LTGFAGELRIRKGVRGSFMSPVDGDTLSPVGRQRVIATYLKLFDPLNPTS